MKNQMPSPEGKNISVDYDSLWKEVIEEFFEDFLQFFAPDLYARVDFSRGYEFLEQELQTLFPDAESEKKYTDKLAKVYIDGGEEKWVLAHIEIQGSRDAEFAERMFRYFYRVYDKYNRKIFALAIFSDESPSYAPDMYHYNFFNTMLTYKYRTYKILTQNEDELMMSENPFALAVLAGLYIIQSKKDVDARYQFKMRLIRLLLQKNFPREKIEKLFVFIDSLLKLPADKEQMFEAELVQLTKRSDDSMGLSWDKSNLAEMYYSKGKAEGKAEFARNLLKEDIDMNIQLIAKASGLSIEEIQRIKDEIAKERGTH